MVPHACNTTALAFAGLISLAPFTCHAALTITAAGSDLNEPNWSTAGHGQLGHIFFAADGTTVTGNADPTTGMVKSGPSWLGDPAGLSSSVTNDESPDVALEGLASTGALLRFGINNDLNYGLATISFGAGVPDTLRVGLLVGAQRFNTDVGVDIPAAVSLGERVGTSTLGWVSQATDRSGLSANDIRADWYFFEVSDIQAGEVLTIGGQRSSATAPDKFVVINGVTFDVIPEPSSALLIGLGGLVLLCRRR